MHKSHKKQGQSFGRRGNPAYQSGGGGFEQTGTGYRYDDQSRQFGSQQTSGEFGGRNWPGQEDWRNRSENEEGRSSRQDYDPGRRFGRGGYEGTRGQQSSSVQEYPESYRERGGQSGREGEYGGREYGGREDESRYGRGREDYGYGSEDYEGTESGYQGYEPGEYSSGGGRSRWGGTESFGGYRGTGRQGWPQGSSGQGRSQASFGQGSFGQMSRGSFGGGSSRQFGQERGQESQGGWQQSRGGTQGSFAGRGPQGYKRSDERITEDINEMLTQDPHLDATNISVEVQNGEVTLKGTVPDREAKRRAEDLAESSSGVKDVQNQIRVKREDESESETRRDKGDDKQRSHKQQLAS